MRILSVTAQKADSTGSGVFLTELVGCFQRAGHVQAVLCGTMPGEEIRMPEGVAVYPVCYATPELPFDVCGMSDEMPYDSTRYRDLNEEMTGQLFAAFRSRIRQAVEEFKPDVILCHHLYFLAALIRQMYPDLKVYGQCHGSDLRQFGKNPWQREMIQENIPKLDGIFALHEQQKEKICSVFGISADKVRVFGVGYSSRVFYLDREAKERKPADKIRVIFAGKLSEKKGVYSLLRAIQYLPEPHRYELRLAGGYSTLQELEAMKDLAQKVPCQVSFLGRLDHATLAREMNESDIFVLPSFFEGLPLVLMEAMACGLRVVCTDLPGIRPWLDSGVPGHGVRFVTPPAMRNEDEPVKESLPDFERELAAALEEVQKVPLAEESAVLAHSWKGLAKKYISIWKD